MSFSFNFPSPKKDDKEEDEEQSHAHTCSRSVTQLAADDLQKEYNDALTSQEVKDFYSNQITDKLSTTFLEFGDCRLKIVDTSTLEESIVNDETLKTLLKDSNTYSAISLHSDLVSGTYEGGLKIWECGVDLTNFLSTHPKGQEITVENKAILEVGCGVGLPGLYCSKKGAKWVHFQDYNEEVLKLLTYSNVKMNTENDEVRANCRFFAGDWDLFTNLVSNMNLKYDVILTAETIYNEASYAKLHRLFNSLLAEGGKILLAAKTYYFGVGGSVDAFCEFVDSQDMFIVEEVHSIQKGVPRKIMCLQRKSPNR